ncbi:SDR family oxidoreductase [Kineosporia sp. J2-2]|uniref:SDR family oxidoreductase n=1 Tax=Kineosporia corallincola TaxID=2835133 RepID=A0ABS5TFJ5_9ACTN|nr:SDR family oxidoreductase [Kineosporia corallincola]MBT0769865.1 SDR family oxidoreductase [Kineosporia corallincola]
MGERRPGTRGVGERALVVASDTSSPDDRAALAELVRSGFGFLDLLFANAGITGASEPFTQVTESRFDEVFAINAKGPYFTVQSLVPLMPAGSSVVLTTSAANRMGMPMMSVYSASKAALRSMARTLATDLMPLGIRVNAVSPGPIDTGILHRSMPTELADQLMASMREENLMKRFGTEDEVVRAVLYLGFEATFNTGAELAADGGGLLGRLAAGWFVHGPEICDRPVNF